MRDIDTGILGDPEFRLDTGYRDTGRPRVYVRYSKQGKR